eukprot:CAMPEP_0171679180 /NCGR_PEP_ID=MMETSP0990-20121206/56088_1 /TAXON_ID=483369 /ORGANISM="non described non described, Strain CCMP2098" /LENGTH=87 /DNA_ID=CAMNT_0012265925 /DNA_START=195 /DNA_END=458 /DNA_ORIENTATION=-
MGNPALPSHAGACFDESPSLSWLRAHKIAITAHVPVPHGLRSSIPVQVDGRSQSRVPLDITTAFRAWAPLVEGSFGGARQTIMSGPT